MSDELTAIRTVLAEPEGPSDLAWRSARTALMAEIEAVTRSGAPAPRRRHRWVPAVGLGTAVILAAGLVLLITQVFVRGSAVQPASAAAAVLRRAAQAAPIAPRLKPGQVWFSDSLGTYRDTGGNRRGLVEAEVTVLSKVWIGRERAVVRQQTVKATPVPGSRSWQVRAVRSVFPLRTRTYRMSAGEADAPVSYQRMLSAPSSTAALARWVLHVESPRGFTPQPRYRAEITFTSIHDIPIEPLVPSRLRSGLYRVLATVPGVHMLGEAYDWQTRRALVVGFRDQSSGYEDELLFDPSDYALLDYRETDGSRLVEQTAFLNAGVVHRFGQVIGYRHAAG